jgi:hypothetical protein
MNKNTCKACLCRDCIGTCPVPCKALHPCDTPVTKCRDYKEGDALQTYLRKQRKN